MKSASLCLVAPLAAWGLSACGLAERLPESLQPEAPAPPAPPSTGSPVVPDEVMRDPPPPPKPACAELHIVGIYESMSNHGAAPFGKTKIRFARPGNNILFLSSYEPTHWTVELAPGAALAGIVLSGYNDQAATVPMGVPVEVRTYEGRSNYLGAYGYAWPFSSGGSDTPLLVQKAEDLTMRRLTSFHGCYRLTDVEVRSDLSSTGDCPLNEGYVYSQHRSTEPCTPNPM